MTNQSKSVSEIIAIMRDYWDLPPDCNDGELFTYAEILFDRIVAGVENPAPLEYFSGNIAAGAIVLHNQVFMPGSSKIRHKAAAGG